MSGDAAVISLSKGFSDSSAGAAAQAASRMQFWEALEENAGSMGAPVTGAMTRVKTAATVPVFDALVAPLVDRKLGKEFDAAQQQQEQNPYTQLQQNIDALPQVAPIKQIAEPSRQVVNKNVAADNDANKFTLDETKNALAAVAEVEDQMDKLAAAEAAGEVTPPPAAEAPGQQKPGGGLMKGAALDVAATAALSAVHPALGMAFGVASTGMTIAKIMGPAADQGAEMGRGGFGVHNEGDAGRYATKAQAKAAPLAPAQGSAPAAHTFAAAAQGPSAPGVKPLMPPDDLAAKINNVSDSLSGIAKAPVQESPVLAAMRQDVDKIKMDLTEMHDKALGRDSVYRDIARNGFDVNARTVSDAMSNGMKINLDGNGPLLNAGMRLG